MRVVVVLPLLVMLARLLGSQLFEVSPPDPYVLAAAVGLVALVAVVAALLPARKAAAVGLPKVVASRMMAVARDNGKTA